MIRAFAKFDDSLLESVSGANLTGDGTPAPDYAAFADGSKGIRIDDTDESASGTLWNGNPLTVPQGYLGCRIKTLQAFTPGVTSGLHVLNRIRGLSSGNAVQVYLDYGPSKIDGIRMFLTSLNSGGPKTKFVDLAPDLTLASGEEMHIGVAWFTDPNDPNGPMGVWLAINGDIVNGEPDIARVDHLPIDIRFWHVGRRNASTEYANCIIQDACFIDGFVDPEHALELGQGRFDESAIGDDDVYQPEYVIDGLHVRDLHPYHVKCLDPFGIPIATDQNDRSDLWRAVDDAANGWETTKQEGPDTRIWSAFVHGQYLFCCTASKLWRGLYEDWPHITWEQNLTLTIQPPGTSGGHVLINNWCHTTHENHLMIGEYEPTTLGGAKVYHSDDYGDTWNTRHTLPTTLNPTTDRYHVHTLRYVGPRVWYMSGDFRDIHAYSDDNGANWTAVAGDMTPTKNLLVQGLACMPSAINGDIFWTSDSAKVMGLAICLREGAAVQPWDNNGDWNARFRLVCPVAGKYSGTAFAGVTLPNGTLLVQNTTENGATGALWVGSRSGGVFRHAGDRTSNDWHGFVTNERFAYGGRFQIPTQVQIDVPRDSRASHPVARRVTRASAIPVTKVN